MRDAVELEIAKYALTSLADEMAVVVLKSAFSIILKNRETPDVLTPPSKFQRWTELFSL
jgi:N-methylhydantoinase B/oxoprolinase/acetone carboxylase alpha subunit